MVDSLTGFALLSLIPLVLFLIIRQRKRNLHKKSPSEADIPSVALSTCPPFLGFTTTHSQNSPGIFLANVEGERWHFVTGLDHIDFFFQTIDNIALGASKQLIFYPLVGSFFGGIMAVIFDKHIRAFLQTTMPKAPIIHPPQYYQDMLWEESGKLMKLLKGGEYDLNKLSILLSFSITFRTFFGVSVDKFTPSESEELVNLVCEYRKCQNIWYDTAVSAVPKSATLEEIKARIGKIVLQLVSRGNSSENVYSGLLGSYILRQMPALHFWGTFNSIAVTVFWFFLDAVRDPNAKRVLMEDASKPYRETKFFGKRRNPYLIESLRVHAMSKVVVRRMKQDFTYSFQWKGKDVNYDLQTGDKVIYVPSLAYRDPAYFEDPKAYRPERFSKDSKTNVVDKLLTFGSGFHKCVAQSYATNVMDCIFYSMFKNFEMHIPESVADPAYDEFNLLNLPVEAVNIKLTPKTIEGSN